MQPGAPHVPDSYDPLRFRGTGVIAAYVSNSEEPQHETVAQTSRSTRIDPDFRSARRALAAELAGGAASAGGHAFLSSGHSEKFPTNSHSDRHKNTDRHS